MHQPDRDTAARLVSRTLAVVELQNRRPQVFSDNLIGLVGKMLGLPLVTGRLFVPGKFTENQHDADPCQRRHYLILGEKVRDPPDVDRAVETYVKLGPHSLGPSSLLSAYRPAL